MSLSDTIVPWLVGGLLLLSLVTFSITIKSWRETKRSPYFFLRVQAAKKMERYMLCTLILFLVTVATSAYAWPESSEVSPQLALISYAKPAPEAVVEVDEPEALADSSPTALDITLSPVSNSIVDVPVDLVDPLLKPALPEKFNQIEPTEELLGETEIGKIAFSTDITSDYRAIEAGQRFGKGFFTLYATFDYSEMLDGMTWSWVWRHNGQVIEGGNQRWAYGNDGPGYVYFRPEEGFLQGQYELEVWVNNELMAQSDFMVIDSISASN